MEMSAPSRTYVRVEGGAWGKGKDSEVSQISPDSRVCGDLRFVLAASGDSVGHPSLSPHMGNSQAAKNMG